MRRDVADEIVRRLHDLRAKLNQQTEQPALEFVEDEEEEPENAPELDL